MTITTFPLASDLSIDEFCLDTGGLGGRPLHFTTDGDDMDCSVRFRSSGDILIRISVDGENDQVILVDRQSSQLALLDAAFVDLQRVRDTLAAVTPSAARGRCMLGTEWGRCKLRQDHEGHCEGPTEEQWRAALAPLETRKVQSA